MPNPETPSITRAEWLAAIGLLLNLATFLFVAGVVYQQVQEHERRIVQVETDNRDITRRIERIDANVTFLADRAREDRQRMENGR